MGRLVGADSGLWEWLWTMGLCPCCARACAMCTIAARLLFVSELCAKQLRQVNDIAKSSSSCFRAVPSRVCLYVCLSVHNPIVNRFTICVRHLRNLLPAAVCGIPSGAGFKRVSAAAVNDVHDAAQRIAHSERERERDSHTTGGVAGSQGQRWACSQQVHDSVPSRQWTVDSRLPAAGCWLPAVL